MKRGIVHVARETAAQEAAYTAGSQQPCNLSRKTSKHDSSPLKRLRLDGLDRRNEVEGTRETAPVELPNVPEASLISSWGLKLRDVEGIEGCGRSMG